MRPFRDFFPNFASGLRECFPLRPFIPPIPMVPNAQQLHLLILNVGKATHHADWNWRGVRSPFSRLYYVAGGTARVLLPDRGLTLRAGHLYYIPAFLTHSYVCEGDFTHYYVHIYENDASGESPLDSLALPAEVEAHALDARLMERLCEINPSLRLPSSDPATYDNQPTLLRNIARSAQLELGRQVESAGILFQLLSRFIMCATPAAPAGDSRIRQVLRHIRRHIHEPLTVPALADVACLSASHLIRLFRRETGMTPIQYVNLRKMERAQLMLLTSDTPVKNVILQLGFSDPSYFDRLFRRQVGMTPVQYRARSREGLGQH